MKRISIKRPSDRIISRMRNGHNVRMMKGEGLDILMKPAKILKMAKKFMTGKGIQISLDPEEVSANKEIEGCGIFGKKFDKALSKKPGLKKAVYAVGSVAKPFVQEGIKAAEAMAIAYGVPPTIASKIGDTAAQYVEDPESLQGKKGLRELKRRGIELGQEGLDMATSEMGMDRVDLAGIVKKVTPKKGAPPAPSLRRQFQDFKSQAITTGATSLAEKLAARFAEPSGQGLYAGRGLYGGSIGLGAFSREKNQRVLSLQRVKQERSISGQGALIGGEIAPALRSQPYSANYQFGVTLGIQK